MKAESDRDREKGRETKRDKACTDNHHEDQNNVNIKNKITNKKETKEDKMLI